MVSFVFSISFLLKGSSVNAPFVIVFFIDVFFSTFFFH